MTGNQVNFIRAKTDRAAAKETARSNRAKEKLQDKDRMVKEFVAEHDANYKRRMANQGLFKTVAGIGSVMGGLAAANDPSWYNKSPEAVKDAASLSFETALGTVSAAYKNFAVGSSPTAPAPGKMAVPGVMGIGFIPAIGSSVGGEVAPINVAARKVFADIRKGNSGATNYEASDVIQYILGMDSILMWIAHGRRIYSLAKESKTHNRYYPRGVMKAMKVNSKSFEDNLANFRLKLNLAADKVNAFALPNKWTLFLRHAWLCGNIFKDYPIKKSQVYVLFPEVLYKYNWANAQLVPIDPYSTEQGDTDLTVDMWNSVFEDLIAQYLPNEDSGTISGDIKKRYDNDVFTIEMIPEDYHIESSYSAEVLTQIQGATLCGTPDLASLTISQTQDVTAAGVPNDILIYGSKAGLFTAPAFSTEGGGSTGTSWLPGEVPDPHQAVLQMYKDDVTPDDNMVASRLIVSGELSNTGELGITFTAETFGTELCTSAYITSYVELSGTKIAGLNIDVVASKWNFFRLEEGNDFTSTMINLFRSTTQLSKFDWAPNVLQGVSFADSSSTTDLVAFQDITDYCNYCFIGEEQIENMHQTALLSLLNVVLRDN